MMLHVDYFAHLLVDHGQLFIGTDTDPRAKISCQACVMLGLKVSNPIISYEIVHARSHFTLSSSCVNTAAKLFSAASLHVENLS